MCPIRVSGGDTLGIFKNLLLLSGPNGNGPGKDHLLKCPCDQKSQFLFSFGFQNCQLNTKLPSF